MIKQAIFVASLFASITNAYATVGYLLEGAGPVSSAMGGTGVSNDIGSDAMVYNPATLMLMPDGNQFHAGLNVIIPDIKFKYLPSSSVAVSGNRGNNNGPFFLPEISYVLRKGDYAFGIGVFPGGGIGTQYGSSSWLSNVGNYNTGLDVFDRLIAIRIPFSVSYNVTDRLSVGASLNVVYENLNLGTFVPGPQLQSLAAAGLATGSLVRTLGQVPGLLGGYVNFSKNSPIGGGVSGWGLGGQLGFTYQIDQQTRLGFAYNFETTVSNLTGNGGLSAVTANGTSLLSGGYTVYNFQLPASFAIGISRRFDERLLLAFDFKRIFFAKTNQFLSFGFSQGGGKSLSVNIPTYGSNVNVFAFGAAYDFNDKLTLRLGTQYAQESENPKYLTALLPGIPTLQFTGGASYKLSKNESVDFSLEYASKTLTGYPYQTTHSQIDVGLGYNRKF
ncbi:OmpP1/FadL family transporter [Burkholderia multivorans]|uniref:OmpP1/FadL family transporter n=1 Tax=Burkholderia multivorans TaxID=87883 RepID=UPI0011B1DEBF|nr:outer membrane protein transport protein [Burkholderia multivorans]